MPLYSLKGKRIVQERSELNQWNARGRKRDPNELYIPIPKKIHTLLPSFFPKRDEKFELQLPNDKKLSAKVCQEGSKALMSNPNDDLGRWLLREVLNTPEGKLITIQDLDNINIDSVKITKYDNETFLIDFTKVGSYQEFLDKFI